MTHRESSLLQTAYSLRFFRWGWGEGVHGLQTSNEGINQRNLKIWADVADKICFGRTQQLGMGVNFRPCSDGDFLTGRA